MPSRLTKPRPTSKTKSGIFSALSDYEGESDSLSSRTDSARAVTTSAKSSTSSKVAKFFSSSSHERSSSRTSLANASDGAVSAMPWSAASGNSQVRQKPLPAAPISQSLGRMNSTIRTVQSFEGRDSEDSSTDVTSRNSAFSSSVNSNASGLSAMSQQPQQYQKDSSFRIKGSFSAGTMDSYTTTTLDVPRSHPSGAVPMRPSVEMSRSSVEIPQRESSLSAITVNGQHMHDGEIHMNGGDAARGKTGRMLDKLIAEKEALLRDYKYEKTKAEELRQGARLLADKNKLLEEEKEKNNLEKDLMEARLARKERQVETLQGSIMLEKARAVEAGERERTWRAEMERIRSGAKREVEEASTHAALMEGRYNAISSHWKDQGDEVKRAMAKMKIQVTTLLEERRKDDDRIGTLRDLCDQQDGNIRDLQKQKDSISIQFEKYKAEQDAALHDIKTKAREREEEQERTLRETKEVLDKLKWALNVNNNVKGAE
ncbi:hypothetical protein GQ53DRAFT_366982 [Thozetella sp. PMI_491]|nr:hypothetical protein GQ53DRAFT_366982 [Thozetella sp. PMI_491]